VSAQEVNFIAQPLHVEIEYTEALKHLGHGANFASYAAVDAEGAERTVMDGALCRCNHRGRCREADKAPCHGGFKLSDKALPPICWSNKFIGPKLVRPSKTYSFAVSQLSTPPTSDVIVDPKSFLGFSGFNKWNGLIWPLLLWNHEHVRKWGMCISDSRLAPDKAKGCHTGMTLLGL
jgi:hypothetical protein